jgi:two-component system nitrogen regulation sensor histidine kinase GlnL
MRDVPWEELLAHVADGLVVADESSCVRWMNPAAEQLAGRSSARGAGKPLAEVFAAAPEIAALAERAREAKSPVERDGLLLHDVPVDALAVAFGDGGVVLTLRDRTVARALEADARRADRLESLAGIAAGIAHEVKNPLGGIRGAAQLLARSTGEKEKEYLELIVREVDRIALLVDRLKDLSAPESGRREPVDVNRLLHEMAKLQQTIGEAQIELNLDPSLPAVEGDPESLQRLFLNVLRNALEAAKAKVLVSTRVETGRRFRDRAGALHALVRIAIEDDGAGIPAEARGKLFQPFFTTKPKGTGLGLAVAQRIAHDHEGTIAAEERAPSGARLVITLPASRGAG